MQVVAHVLKGRQRGIDERERLKDLLTAASDEVRDALELQCCSKSTVVQRSGRRDKSELVIALIKEDATARNDFPRCCEGGNDRLLIQDDEQQNRWKEIFTTVLDRITSSEVPLLLDEMASPPNIWTSPPKRRKIISANNALKRSKTTELDVLLTEEADMLPRQIFLHSPH